jgi:hypothetical protein
MEEEALDGAEQPLLGQDLPGGHPALPGLSQLRQPTLQTFVRVVVRPWSYFQIE